MILKKKLKSFLPFYIICICLFFYVFYFSYKALWLNDDILYRFHFGTNEPIRSLADIITSQIVHYFTINGRFIPHVLVQFSIAFLEHLGFALVNGIVYVIFILLIMNVLHITYKGWGYTLCLVLLLLFGFQTKFVPTCQIGYIWMFSFVLGYLLYFFRCSQSKSVCFRCFLIIYSIIAGWSNEALAVGVSVALIIYVLRSYTTITLTQWLMFFSFGVGVALLCFSPATLSRTNAERASVDFLTPWMYSLVKLVFYSRCSYLLFAYVSYLFYSKRVTVKEFYFDNSFAIHTYISLLLMNLIIGVFGNRQLFGMELCAIIIIVNSYVKYGRKRNLIFFLFPFLCWFGFKTISNINFLNRIEQIYTAIQKTYNESSDGIVYYDLERKDVIFNETYPSSVFTSHVIKAMDLYFHYLGSSETKKLQVLPTVCKSLDGNKVNIKNRYINNAEDAHTIILSKKNMPKSIVQSRKVVMCGFNFPFKDRIIDMSGPIYEDDSSIVLQIYDKIPFIKCDTIMFY